MALTSLRSLRLGVGYPNGVERRSLRARWDPLPGLRTGWRASACRSASLVYKWQVRNLA
ncbi:MAG: hypothetical protein OXG81_15420 [Acidobacteria bacterium]|nr:hypothetical protein [Acidobacteriota bacterium]